ncbi:hypothetical protein BO70DRAFT_360450 [Aspergillus heteromorphus CBS 117.55]|uniref:Uncharacterized protein n=1 Tax=Aspergillus heteromorphus CBS 117.55 TaxID=1448321 RepID=A0A317WP19_9EURO|nr:uncharacterized protein BO70DRAFT_360450 [Aspergillus heteromorphus CBS 117.55]PWY86678.1 hypothetical protein BO70DRAFT_360450 [Aspergillus heteromorphus CBS 117.55]
MTALQTPEWQFRSQRLLYRALEDNDEDKTFIQNQILNDPTIQMMSLGARDMVAK